jgi:CheY-like chemotaxis protein
MDKKRVLLADDEEMSRLMMSHFLKSRGYEVLTAFDGLDAVTAAEAERPDAVILDVMMPVMDGFEVARKLKANPDTAQIPIVLLSGAADAESRDKGHQVGAEEFVGKPFEPLQMAELLARLTDGANKA